MDRELNREIKAVIFDMDGVLINSEPLWRKAEIETFNELGFDFTEEMCCETMGMRTKEVIEYWYEKLQWKGKNIDEVTDMLLEKIHRLVQQEGKPMSGVKEAIAFLKRKNMPIAVASSSPFSLIHLVLEKLNIKDAFQIIESAEHLPYGKPHPQIFLNTAEKLNILPQNCLVIEDSFHGMIAAKAALMFTVIIPEPGKYNENKWSVADKKITSLNEFPALF